MKNVKMRNWTSEERIIRRNNSECCTEGPRNRQQKLRGTDQNEV